MCTPAKNEETTIADLVDSIQKQNYNGPLEHLICVNGSTDHTVEVVQELCRKYPNIHLMTSEPGKANAWKNLVDKSSYNALLFTDADVIIGQNSLKALQRTLRSKSHYAAAVGDRVKILVGLDFFSKLFHYPRELKGVIARKNRKYVHVSGACYILDKTKFLKRMHMKGYDHMPSGIISEDRWVSLVLKDMKYGAVVSDNIGYTPEAKFYFQAWAWDEHIAIERRIHKGYFQLDKQHPVLKNRDDNWQLMPPMRDLIQYASDVFWRWKESPLLEKILMPSIYPLAQATAFMWYNYAKLEAWLECRNGKLSNLWASSESSKKELLKQTVTDCYENTV